MEKNPAWQLLVANAADNMGQCEATLQKWRISLWKYPETSGGRVKMQFGSSPLTDTQIAAKRLPQNPCAYN